MHDLRLAYLHRHFYRLLHKAVEADGSQFYIFRCEDCRRHGKYSDRRIKTSVFWGPRTNQGVV